jgi:hypothetical protein
MITSGLVLTLNADPNLAGQAQTAVRARPEFTLGAVAQRWLPVVFEVPDVSASRDLHDWLHALPGVEFVDVVQVNFEDAELQQPLTRPSATLSPSDGERDGVRGSSEPFVATQLNSKTPEVSHEH